MQALNYANARGHRWVVLSNGRQWLLFDNHLMGVEAPQRLVAQAELADPGFVDLLIALSKPSITADRLGQYVTKSRVRSALDQQLADKSSEAVKAITSALKKLGIVGVQASDVAEYFSGPTATLPTAPSSAPPSADMVSIGDAYTLSQLFAIRDRLPGTIPAQVRFPDGSAAGVPYWADVAQQVVRWLAQAGKLPQLPFRGLPSGDRWFINSEPTHPSGKNMLAPRSIDAGGRTLYVELKRGVVDLVTCLCSCCEVAGEAANGFVVRLAKHPSAE